MKKFTLGIAALAALLFVGFDAIDAQAYYGIRNVGVHIGGRNVQHDVARPDCFQDRVLYRSSHSFNPYYNRYYRTARRVDYDWYNRSHFDYHPGGFVRHGNHYDYVPGRYVWHEQGHWDAHRGRHR